MKIQDHLRELKNYKTPSMLDGVNKLYFLEVIEKPGLVKIGDTHRLVETRNDETIKNASLHRSKPVTWVIADKWDGSRFRDTRFHSFLENKKYIRELNDNGNKSEWFFISLDDALKELKEFIRKPVTKEVELRPAQTYLNEKIQEAIDSGNRFINAGLCVRVGKTILSLITAKENDWFPVYIGKNLTSQNSAETDNAEYGIVTEMLTQSLHGVDEYTDGELSKRTKAIIANIERTNVSNKQIVFFIDEVDDASHTKKSRDIIKPVVEYFKENNQFGLMMPMSGTRIWRGEKILYALTDSFVELALEYYEMQILQPETTCRREYRHISFYANGADGLSNISDAMKNSDAGHKSLATAIEKLLGTNNFEFVVNPKFPHWFIKFATVGKSNLDKLVNYLNRKCSTVEQVEYHFGKINGDVTCSKDAQDYCHEVIKKHPGKICVFFSQGMATTSFSVKRIGNSAVFTDNELTADDIQALHRSATYDTGKDYCNMIVVTTNDSMDHSFDDIFEQETRAAEDRGGKIEIYRELLNNNSMVHFTVDGNIVRSVKITVNTVDKVLDKKAKEMTKLAGMVNVLADLDEELLEDIVATMGTKKSTSKRSKSTKGNEFDPFGGSKPKSRQAAIRSTETSLAKREKKIKAFVEAARNAAALAQEQEVTLAEINFWEELGVPKELFFDVYNSIPNFKDRIDTIYSLCSDDEYLIKNYIDNQV